MRLRIANAKGALFAEMRDVGVHHPEALFRACVELAGELATFSRAMDHRCPVFPAYDHDDLQGCFAPVIRTIVAALDEVSDPDAYNIALDVWPSGGYHASIAPAHLLPDGRFIVVAKASMTESAFRTAFTQQTTVASANDIVSYVTAQDRGARLEPLTTVPGELKPLSGWTYFEVQKGSRAWEGIVQSKSIAFYEANAFDGLELQLWGIRSRK